MHKQLNSVEETFRYGETLAQNFKGGEVLELIGDVGAGKTTLVKGIARGLGVTEPVQSPSFTIFAEYEAGEDRQLHHYDFYRLHDPGLVGHDLAESLSTKGVITIVEWADTVQNILPERRITIRITPLTEDTRLLDIQGVS